MDGREGRAPALGTTTRVNGLGGAENTSQARSERRQSALSPGHHSRHSATVDEAQTWMDFLRLEHQPANPADAHSTHQQHHIYPIRTSSRSALLPRGAPLTHDVFLPPDLLSMDAGRRRRMTTGEPPPRQCTNNMGSSNPASSDAAPNRHSHTFSHVDSNPDIVLPPWQPDDDATECPVCHKQFSFFYRKHHCRKCGRVVCNPCSPHRITIPRQFIVRAPYEAYEIGIDFQQVTHPDPSSPNPALGGGEEVRVCNPCVPDPNYSPPPQYGQPSGNPASYASFRTSFQSSNQPTGHVTGHNRPSHVTASSLPLPEHSRNARRASFQRTRWRETPAPSGTGFRWETSASFPHPPPSAPNERQLPEPPSAPAPRRQIPEEDECPICGEELPAIGANGDDTARVTHVTECISLHSTAPQSFTPGTPPQTQPLPASTTPQSPHPPSSPSAAGTSRHRISLSARGLFPSTATEKDGVDEEGNPAECVICFEEFTSGDRLARLVRWCKFHEVCIRDWWEVRGPGNCPVHQQSL